MRTLFLHITALFLISFALFGTEVQRRAQVQEKKGIAERLVEESEITLNGKISGSPRFSPDGQKVLGPAHNTVKVWNTATGELEFELLGHTGSVRSAEFSPDGKYIVTASWDRTAKIWDIETRSLLKTLEGHTASLTSAEFSPDGKYVVTSSFDNTARIFDAVAGKEKVVLRGHSATVYSAKFSPDSTYVVTASKDKTAKIWRVDSPIPVHDLIGHTDSLISAEFSHDGTKVLTVSKDNTARIWDALEGTLVRTFVCEYDPIKSAHFSPDDTLIIIAPADILNVAQIFNVATGAKTTTYGKSGRITSAEFSPDGRQAVVTDSAGMAEIWDVTDLYRDSFDQLLPNKSLLNIVADRSALTSAVFSPDSKKVVTASQDGTAKVWMLDARRVGIYFLRPPILDEYRRREPIQLQKQAFLAALDGLSRQKKGGKITKANLFGKGPIDQELLVKSIPQYVRDALKSLYNLSDDIFNGGQP